MKLHTPLLAITKSVKEVEILRIIPGSNTQLNLVTQPIARIKFNSKFTAAKPRVLGNFFLRPYEMYWITLYAETCIANRKLI